MRYDWLAGWEAFVDPQFVGRASVTSIIGAASSTTSPARRSQRADSTVSESRVDPLTGEWTIFAPERDGRPNEFKRRPDLAVGSGNCPFCEGREAETPAAVWVGRIDGDDFEIDARGRNASGRSVERSDAWSVRVVPNKFPAINTPPQSRDHAGESREQGFFQSRPIGGGHEVIIESPRHIESLSDLNFVEASLVFRAYRDRIRIWRDRPDVRYISLFKNVGGQAGASLRHSHSQLMAVDNRPKWVSGTLDRMRHHRATTGCCLQCDLLRAELKAKRRVIAQTRSLVAYCPFASRLPMLVRITTKDHQACFEDLPEETLDEVSRLAVRVVSWMEKLHPRMAYNHILNTCPPHASGGEEAFHWSMEIFPRLTQVAGFEWSSQCMINPVLPESAAARLAACASAEDPRTVLSR